ncbi:hypothetical protein J4463_02685 [Candidatus Pacearchaeota archaeon]|nr:hypothetical protein [Candidatus Pacearchaeota archaeon]
MKSKIEEKFFKVFITAIILILCFAMLYFSANSLHSYFAKSDEQICQFSNSILINGQCHFEFNRAISEKRNILLFAGIVFPIFSLLLLFYLAIILKKMRKNE